MTMELALRDIADFKPVGVYKGLSFLPGEVDVITLDFDDKREIVTFKLRNTRPYVVTLHPFYSQGHLVSLTKSFGR
jgi:hypothetical protein